MGRARAQRHKRRGLHLLFRLQPRLRLLPERAHQPREFRQSHHARTSARDHGGPRFAGRALHRSCHAHALHPLGAQSAGSAAPRPRCVEQRRLRARGNAQNARGQGADLPARLKIRHGTPRARAFRRAGLLRSCRRGHRRDGAPGRGVSDRGRRTDEVRHHIAPPRPAGADGEHQARHRLCFVPLPAKDRALFAHEPVYAAKRRDRRARAALK